MRVATVVPEAIAWPGSTRMVAMAPAAGDTTVAEYWSWRSTRSWSRAASCPSIAASCTWARAYADFASSSAPSASRNKPALVRRIASRRDSCSRVASRSRSTAAAETNPVFCKSSARSSATRASTAPAGLRRRSRLRAGRPRDPVPRARRDISACSARIAARTCSRWFARAWNRSASLAAIACPTPWWISDTRASASVSMVAPSSIVETFRRLERPHHARLRRHDAHDPVHRGRSRR